VTKLQDIWKQLTNKGQMSEGYVRLRIPNVASCSAYAARNLSSRGAALMFELNTEHLPIGMSFPAGAGFDITATAFMPGRTGRTRITLESFDETYADVFQSLAEDVIDYIANAKTEREAIQILIRRVAKWQAFLKMFGNKGLSLEHRRGLWGEMLSLQWLAGVIGWDRAVSTWRTTTFNVVARQSRSKRPQRIPRTLLASATFDNWTMMEYPTCSSSSIEWRRPTPAAKRFLLLYHRFGLHWNFLLAKCSMRG
jgi:hypothetical protein